MFPMGVDMFFVRPANGKSSTSVLTKEYTPEPGADFSIDNGVNVVDNYVTSAWINLCI